MIMDENEWVDRTTQQRSSDAMRKRVLAIDIIMMDPFNDPSTDRVNRSLGLIWILVRYISTDLYG